ncbi:MAG: LssY C-terminal domain-containing protein [Bryobacteraceae bacterium]
MTLCMAFGLLLAALVAALPLRAADPAPLRIEARLLTPISTYSTRAGSTFEAAITTPLCGSEGELPEGTVIRGSVAHLHRVGLGFIHETASLRLEFSSIHFADGGDYAVDARLASIDNARERVDSHGTIHGERATSTLSNRFSERLAFLAMGHPMAMIPAFAVESAFFHFPDPEIHYRRGTEFNLDVRFPEALGEVSACEAAPMDLSVDDQLELDHIVDELPYWSYSKRQRQPIDLVNLMFVGPEQSLLRAFNAAGWTGSLPNSMRNGMGAIRAIVESHEFSDAPMRTLLLDGHEADLRFQKSLNTFEMRHHMRIWARDDEWRGRQLWASAATQDIGTTFSIHPFGFTHQIQVEVDQERDKVVSDLVYTGCVDSVTYVQRPESLRESGFTYRRGVSSDARVAVVSLNACEQPRLDLVGGPEPAGPRGLAKFVRRVTLTARNHFLRDNWFWRSADDARIAFVRLRDWNRQSRQERLARQREFGIAAKVEVAAPVGGGN